MKTGSRLPWILLACAAPVFAGTMVLSLLNHSFSDPFLFIAVTMVIGYTTVGAVVASREPRNAVGWLMMAIGAVFLLTGASDEYLVYTYVTRPGALPFGVAVAWLSTWLYVLVLGPVPLLLVLFPTGRVPGPGWRLLPRLVIALIVLLALASILLPGPLDVREGIVIQNPTGVPALEGALSLLLLVFVIGLLGTGIASVVALVQRFRRSVGEERQQLRWFVYVPVVASVAVVGALVSNIWGGEENLVSEGFFWITFALVGVGLPAALGIAVLRYRLYDLELVVKKTVLYTTVAVLLTALFLVVALAVGGIVGRSQTGAVVAAAAIGLASWPAVRLARRVADRVVYGGRATPYEILSDFSHRVGASYADEDVLVRMARVLAEALGAARAAVWLRVGGEIRPAAAWPADGAGLGPVRVAGDELPPLPTSWAEEVRHRGELLGALAVDMPPNDPIDPTRQRLVRDLASQAGLVLRNVRLIEELRTSRRRIVTVQDERAKRLERNIHDGAQQQLVALSVKLGLAKNLAGRDPDAQRQILDQLQHEVIEALENLRDLARGIYPPLLADKGLAEALTAQARKSPVPVTVDAGNVGRYPQEVEAAVYFCALEALQNVAKYAEASAARVRLSTDDRRLTFAITDDGHGFDPSTAPAGSGLQNMTDRLAALGGSLEVTSTPGGGTTVAGWLPVRESAAV